jgi:quinol monooxygenase YgiN
MTEGPLPMVLKMLSACREHAQLVETVHLPVDPAKAGEFTGLLDELIAAMRKAPGLVEARTHAPAPGSNEYLIYEVWSDPERLRQWWEGPLLAKFQSALHERQLLTGMPGLHFTRA